MGAIMGEGFWRRCSSCKKEIPFGAIYQACSVSSCKKNVYCSVTCWDVHVPVMNHKSAWAEEQVAPMSDEESMENRPRRRIIVSSGESATTLPKSNIPYDVLIVASKLKSYIKAKSGMNTSASVIDALSEIVRDLSDKAIDNARADGRKTVMDRDFTQT